MAAGIANNVIPDEMAQSLDHDTFVFSGMKVYNEVKEGGLRLRDDNGSVKSFQQFLNDVEKIDKQYNENYLNAEYNFAVHSAQMAAKWADFERDGDAYLLQYRTAQDGLVRAEHAALDDTTLPLNDPFWDKYMPPLAWNCRCTTVQVSAGKYPESNSADALEKGERATTQIGSDGKNKLEMFRFNPGKDLKIFPDKHPYMAQKNSTEDVKKAQKIVKEMAKPEIKTVEDLNKYFSRIAGETGWFERGFKEIKTEPKSQNNGSTDTKGTISLKSDIKNNIISAVNKLTHGENITEKEAE